MDRQTDRHVPKYNIGFAIYIVKNMQKRIKCQYINFELRDESFRTQIIDKIFHCLSIFNDKLLYFVDGPMHSQKCCNLLISRH